MSPVELGLVVMGLGLVRVVGFGICAIWLFAAGRTSRARLAAAGFALVASSPIISWLATPVVGLLPISTDAMVTGFALLSLVVNAWDLLGVGLIAMALVLRARVSAPGHDDVDPIYPDDSPWRGDSNDDQTWPGGGRSGPEQFPVVGRPD